MTVTIETLDAAIAEAKRFVDAADKARTRINIDYVNMVHRHGKVSFPAEQCVTTSAETATARRASMDLTRALAELRRR